MASRSKKGKDSHKKKKRNVKLYDYSKPPTEPEQWKSKLCNEKVTQLPPMRESMGAVYVDEHLYLIGGIGCGGDGRFNTVAELDPRRNRWTVHPSRGVLPPYGRDRLSATAVGQYIYIFGGEGVFNPSDHEKEIKLRRQIFGDMYRFDTIHKVWSDVPFAVKKKAPSARRGHSCVLHMAAKVSPKLIIFGGEGPDEAGEDILYNDVWVFDVKTRVWSKPFVQGSLPPVRASHTAVVVDGVMWVYGGMGGSRVLRDMWTLKLSDWTWNRIGVGGIETPGPLYGHGCVRDPWYVQRMYFFGGRCYRGKPSNALWSFDCNTKTFSKVRTRGEMPEARYGHAMVAMCDSPEQELMLELDAERMAKGLPTGLIDDPGDSATAAAAAAAAAAGATGGATGAGGGAHTVAAGGPGSPGSAQGRRRRSVLKSVRRGSVAGKLTVSRPPKPKKDDVDIDPAELERLKAERRFRKVLLFGGVRIDAPGGFCPVNETHMLYCAPPPIRQKKATSALERAAQDDMNRLLGVASPMLLGKSARFEQDVSDVLDEQRRLSVVSTGLAPWQEALPDVPSTYAEFKKIAVFKREQSRLRQLESSRRTGKSKLQNVVKMKTYKSLGSAGLNKLKNAAAAGGGSAAQGGGGKTSHLRPMSYKKKLAAVYGFGNKPDPYADRFKQRAAERAENRAIMMRSLGIEDSPLKDLLFVQTAPLGPPAMRAGTALPRGGGNHLHSASVDAIGVLDRDSGNFGAPRAHTASAASMPAGSVGLGVRPPSPKVSSTGLPINPLVQESGSIKFKPHQRTDLQTLKRAFAQTPPPERFRGAERVHRIQLDSPPPDGTVTNPWDRPRSGLFNVAGARIPQSPIQTKRPVLGAHGTESRLESPSQEMMDVTSLPDPRFFGKNQHSSSSEWGREGDNDTTHAGEAALTGAALSAAVAEQAGVLLGGVPSRPGTVDPDARGGDGSRSEGGGAVDLAMSPQGRGGGASFRLPLPETVPETTAV